MKIQMPVYVDVRTVEAFKAKAAATGAGLGDLADLLLRYGLAKLDDEAVKRWVANRTHTRGPLGGGLTKKERLTLAAVEALTRDGEGTWRFASGTIADKAGLRHAEAFWALKALEARGSVVGIENAEAGYDRWNRPLKSYWNLPKGSADAPAP